MKKIANFLNLTSIGGVQTIFIYYTQSKTSQEKEILFSKTDIDKEYIDIKEKLDYRKLNFFNFLYFIYTLISNKYINIFYNNIESKQLNLLLKLLPTNNIVLQEHGRIWNMTKKHKESYRYSVKNASLIVVNSMATKAMIKEKFGIDSDKIKIVYNGVAKPVNFQKKEIIKDELIFGFIGRLSTPKGVHVIIETAKTLPQHKFLIAGGGELEEQLKQSAKGYKNIVFLGRIKNPYDFYKLVDILIVPSIREPLGNIIIESGFCKIPVIAAAVDGIPEIIEHKEHGILIKPSKDISINNDDLPHGAPLLPTEVIDPKSLKLITPKEISSKELAEACNYFADNIQEIDRMGNNLYDLVDKKFTVEHYIEQIGQLYENL